MVPNDPATSWIPPLSDFPQHVATVSRTGSVLYVNKPGGPFGPATVGTSMEQSSGTAVWRVLATAVVRAFERHTQTVVDVYAESQERWYECSVGPVMNDDVAIAAVVVAQDVTRRREADQALERSQERLRTLLNTVPDMFFRIAPGGIFSDYFGGPNTFLPPEEFLGRRIDETLPAPAGPLLQRTVEEVARTRAPAEIEYQLPAPDGSGLLHFEARLFVDASEVLTVVRDVTDRKRTQSLLESSEENFRSVIERMPDCVLIHNEGIIRYVNPACMELLGYVSADEFIGRSIFDFIHPEDRARVADRMRAVTGEGVAAPSMELRLLRQVGDPAEVELAPVHIVQLADGPASIVVARDLTQRKKMQERLFLADRVASMGTLAAGIAHEINNPLTYVVGNLTVAAKGLAGLSPSNEDIAVVHDLEKAIADARAGAERVRYIVGDLRAFSRPDRGELEAIDLRRVLDAAISMAWSEIRHRARLLREYKNTPSVLGSETRLGQVFLNLLLNAAQAIAEGDANQHTIRVVTRTDEEGRAVVEICDTGVGIAAEVLDRIWDPFFTTKDGEGTGLGLSICQSIVTSIGGEIVADRHPRFGTVIRVALPPITAMPIEPVEPSILAEPVEPIHGRVLVVDDEPVVATLVRRALEGHDVYIMTSGRDAIAVCRELEFDVIVCDLLMPDLTGMDFYDELAGIDPALGERVVFMTAGAFTQRARKFLGRVHNPVIEKPFDLDDLASTVQSVLQRHAVRSP